jgi:hypothetical protein
MVRGMKGGGAEGKKEKRVKSIKGGGKEGREEVKRERQIDFFSWIDVVSGYILFAYLYQSSSICQSASTLSLFHSHYPTHDLSLPWPQC